MSHPARPHLLNSADTWGSSNQIHESVVIQFITESAILRTVVYIKNIRRKKTYLYKYRLKSTENIKQIIFKSI